MSRLAPVLLPIALSLALVFRLDDDAYRVKALVLMAVSCFSFYLTLAGIRFVQPLLLKANMFGIDRLKDKAKSGEKRVPEAAGIVPATIYVMCLSVFELFFATTLVEYNAALTSVCFMVLLGFADDVLDIRWAIKILLSAWASLPLLVAYYSHGGLTNVIVPVPLRAILGGSVELGFLYLLYMLLLGIFCTNAINIYAGVNGLEAGQSFVIGVAVIIHNLVELGDPSQFDAHLFSIFCMIPFVSVTLALLCFNWYPSRVFVGDTYTYFAGMALAVVGILGHFSKTLMLFFIPQILNFLLSMPQLFKLLPCPRHRMPKRDEKTGLIKYSTMGDGDSRMNLTLISLWLRIRGPMSEERLTTELLVVQALCCGVGFIVRYHVATYFFY